MVYSEVREAGGGERVPVRRAGAADAGAGSGEGGDADGILTARYAEGIARPEERNEGMRYRYLQWRY
jgi:hypothetical protein